MPRFVCAALALVLMPSLSLAQESPIEVARRDLLTRAEQARGDGNHALALDLGTRAGQIRMTPSLRLLIAQEHESLGHTLEALDEARRCAHEAVADSGLRNGPAILARCEEIVRTMEPRVSRLTVRVARAEGTVVAMGAQPLPPALWNVPLPILPGTVRVTATASDGRRFTREVSVVAGGAAEIVIDLPQEGATTARPSAQTSAPARQGPGAGPWILGGLGLASLGAMAAFWALHEDAVSERDAACDASGCDPVALTHDDRARTFTTLTNVSLGLGLAAVGGAVLWYAFAPRRESEVRPAATVGPRIGVLFLPSGGTVTFGGSL